MESSSIVISQPMNLDTVLENWADYENKKLAAGSDVNFFSCSEKWETDYLRMKIKSIFPFINEMYIIGAIKIACENMPDTRSRREFVQAVLKKLGMAN